MSATTQEQTTSNLEFVRNHARELGLRSTEQGTIRLLSLRDGGGLSDDERFRHVQMIVERFHDDIVSLFLFYVPTDRLDYYQKTDLCGDDFKLNFPTANVEITEAGNCFAFDRLRPAHFI